MNFNLTAEMIRLNELVTVEVLGYSHDSKITILYRGNTESVDPADLKLCNYNNSLLDENCKFAEHGEDHAFIRHEGDKVIDIRFTPDRSQKVAPFKFYSINQIVSLLGGCEMITL